MEYQALYRKYRPKLFSEMYGQEHITTILKNQIISGRVSHAYLFSGSRGTGKTTTAKILARVVNCLHPENGEPCYKCSACLSGLSGNVDIIEMDAASNNRVDDMRALIEKSVFAPVSLKKKVYIIDEAHMITSGAFNALLKTLEEPPEHVLFILATTEPQKIIPTIASRCQRFDFRRLRVFDIVNCIENVLKNTDSTIDKEGLITIAQKANGGMRDALSLADQCISFCGKHVSKEDVNHVLGSTDSEYMFKIAETIINSDVVGALTYFEEISQGQDISVFLSDLTAHFRALMFAKLCGRCSEVLDCTEDFMDKALKQAEYTSRERIIRTIDILSSAQTKLKLYSQPAVIAEISLVKICTPENEETEIAAMDRIAQLEKQLSEGVKIKLSESQYVSRELPSISVPKEKAPEKKKQLKPLPKDAKAEEIFKDICSHVNDIFASGVAAYVLSSLMMAKGFELSNDTLTVYFTDRVNRENANANIKQLQGYVTETMQLPVRLVFQEQAVGFDKEQNNEDFLSQVFEGKLDIADD